jgi:hypothetical protein
VVITLSKSHISKKNGYAPKFLHEDLSNSQKKNPFSQETTKVLWQYHTLWGYHKKSAESGKNLEYEQCSDHEQCYMAYSQTQNPKLDTASNVNEKENCIQERQEDNLKPESSNIKTAQKQEKNPSGEEEEEEEEEGKKEREREQNNPGIRTREYS